MTGSIAADGQTPITGQLRAGQGTLSTPPWTFTTDTTAGMFLPAAGIVGLVAGGFGLLANSMGFSQDTAAVANGGSGYVLNDTIILSGGAALRNTVLQVTGVSSGAITSVVSIDDGLYSTVPSNPVAQGSTSGSGVGATFNMTWSNALLFSDSSGAAIWGELGATPYMAGAMSLLNGTALANYIGAAAIAAAVASAIPLPTPQGRLTPTSNVSVITTDTPAATTIFYTPEVGNWNPIHNGSSLIPYQLAGQLQLSLTSAQVGSNIYDLFLYYNGGTPILGTGPSWAAGNSGSVVAGSCARGTGAGGTSLVRLSGVPVNAASILLTYNTGSGNNSVTAPANQAIYLGSAYMDATSGQLTCNLAYGQSRKNGLWNAWNRVPIQLKAGDPTVTWTYPTNVVLRPANANTANSLTVFAGLAEEAFDLRLTQSIASNQVTAAQQASIIGWNSTTAGSGTGAGDFQNSGSSAILSYHSSLFQAPALGINVATALESGRTGATFSGTEAYMSLRAKYNG